MIRVMVTGSRDWTERTIIRFALAQYSASNATLVHGAARGADRMTAEIAKDYGFRVEEHPADWKTHGKAAGVIRNVEMLDSDIDVVVAFQVNDSRGTAHAIREAQKRGIPVRLWKVNGDYTKAVEEAA